MARIYLPLALFEQQNLPLSLRDKDRLLQDTRTSFLDYSLSELTDYSNVLELPDATDSVTPSYRLFIIHRSFPYRISSSITVSSSPQPTAIMIHRGHARLTNTTVKPFTSC
jgi:hypothetical protein